jgi:hypothetical protein
MTMTAQEYRANARQCLSWAESASDPENREAFFALAATWESAAARIEKSTAAPGIQHNRRTFAPSGGLGLTVPDGPPAVRSCGRLAMLAAIRAPRP